MICGGRGGGLAARVAGGTELEHLSNADGGDGPATAAVLFVRSARARRYRLTLRRDGTAVATVPVRGSQREAEKFVAGHVDWLTQARERQRRKPRGVDTWAVGTQVLWRGELTEIRMAVPTEQTAGMPAEHGMEAAAGLRAHLGARLVVCLAADVFPLRAAEGDLRPALEAQFRRRAQVELPARAWELAAETGAAMKNVSVRNQRSRWGSCSARGTVSLNWRLVLTPEFVRDYIILHELAHLREMNHSDRFWARVEEMCPGWREAERWLKQHGSLTGM
jgi:predicted metal-dependent hydrolase